MPIRGRGGGGVGGGDVDFGGYKTYGFKRMASVPEAADIGADGLVLYEGTTTETETLGKTSIGGTPDNNVGYIMATKYTSPEAGTLTLMYLYVLTAMNTRVALYDHDAGNNRPGNLLVESASEACSAAAWHEFNVADTEITAQDYWLAYQQDTSANCVPIDAEGGRLQRYHALTYGAFPNPFGASSSRDNYASSEYAKYDVTGATVRRLYLNVNGTVIYFTPT